MLEEMEEGWVGDLVGAVEWERTLCHWCHGRVCLRRLLKVRIHHLNPAGAPYSSPTKIKAALDIHGNLLQGILGVPMEARVIKCRGVGGLSCAIVKKVMTILGGQVFVPSPFFGGRGKFAI